MRLSLCGLSLLAVATADIGGARDAARTSAAPPPGQTTVLILGDGPLISAERSGTSIGVVVRGTLYVVDAGPGVLRRVFEARQRLPQLGVQRLGPVFITHLHSDHTLGLPELLYYPGSDHLRVYGPPGLREMMARIAEAWGADREIRAHSSMSVDNALARTVNAAEVVERTSGVVYQDSNVKVIAFEVAHGDWPHALGYRVETSDRVIVISGDTRPSDAVVNACDGCDVLVHAVYDGEAKLSGGDSLYFRRFHTSALELGLLARRARPRLVVMYHQIFMGKLPADLVRQVAAGFQGPVMSARDLDVY